MVVETVLPFRPLASMPFWRWLNNLALTAVDYFVILGLAPWISLLVTALADIPYHGLVERLQLGTASSFLVVLLCLELAGYWMHRTVHRIPILWRVHAVHHCDTEVDATTAFRHHPLEVLISTVVTLPIVLILLPDPVVLLAYNILHTAVAIFHHANIDLGRPIESLLGRIIVTPAFHRQHHFSDRQYTDSNYAAILPLFDHVFRTANAMPSEQQKAMQMGLTYFRDKHDARLDSMLHIPFRRDFGEIHNVKAE